MDSCFRFVGLHPGNTSFSPRFVVGNRHCCCPSGFSACLYRPFRPAVLFCPVPPRCSHGRCLTHRRRQELLVPPRPSCISDPFFRSCRPFRKFRFAPFSRAGRPVRHFCPGRAGRISSFLCAFHRAVGRRRTLLRNLWSPAGQPRNRSRPFRRLERPFRRCDGFGYPRGAAFLPHGLSGRRGFRTDLFFFTLRYRDTQQLQRLPFLRKSVSRLLHRRGQQDGRTRSLCAVSLLPFRLPARGDRLLFRQLFESWNRIGGQCAGRLVDRFFRRTKTAPCPVIPPGLSCPCRYRGTRYRSSPGIPETYDFFGHRLSCNLERYPSSSGCRSRCRIRRAVRTVLYRLRTVRRPLPDRSPPPFRYGVPAHSGLFPRMVRVRLRRLQPCLPDWSPFTARKRSKTHRSGRRKFFRAEPLHRGDEGNFLRCLRGALSDGSRFHASGGVRDGDRALSRARSLCRLRSLRNGLPLPAAQGYLGCGSCNP